LKPVVNWEKGAGSVIATLEALELWVKGEKARGRE